MTGKISPFESFNESQLMMLKSFLRTDKQTLICFEDDVVFRPNLWDNIPFTLSRAIAELPDNWDIFYLGCNLFCENWEKEPPAYHSPNLSRIYHAWTTHAIAYSRKAVQWIVDRYDVNCMYDAWLSNSILNNLNAFVMRPMIARQRPGFSDLWNNEADYTDCFVAGDKLLLSNG